MTQSDPEITLKCPARGGPGEVVQLLVCVLNLKIYRKNVCLLFRDPFGSDQSRHVDDFGARNHDFIDLTWKIRILTTFKRKIIDFHVLCNPVVL